MSLMADYHMHTPLCGHARGEPTEYAAQAVRVGLKEIGFSEHNPMIRDDFDDWHMKLGDFDDYWNRIQMAQKNHPQLNIRVALEVDYLPGHEDWIRDLRGRYEWDYFIGSVHYISDEFDIDNPKKFSFWDKHSVFDVWGAYFKRLTQAAQSRLFHTIGHPDLPKKFGFIPREDCRALYTEFLDAVQEADLAVEINTAGLRKDCREIYPSMEFLKLVAERQIPVTFGSDAHAPEEVGMDFTYALQWARHAGLKYTRKFKNWKLETLAI